MEEIKTLEIQDPIYEETYTAHIQKNGAAWIGWIPEVPEVKCEEHTQEALLKTLVHDCIRLWKPSRKPGRSSLRQT